MPRFQFNIQLIIWTTSVVAVSTLLLRYGANKVPEAVFVLLLIMSFPVYRMTRRKDPGVRFIMMGALMATIVMLGIMMAFKQGDHGELVVMSWIFRIALVAIPAALWMVFMIEEHAK